MIDQLIKSHLSALILMLPSNSKIMKATFHGHANDSNGTIFALEWAVADREKCCLILILFFPTNAPK